MARRATAAKARATGWVAGWAARAAVVAGSAAVVRVEKAREVAQAAAGSAAAASAEAPMLLEGGGLRAERGENEDEFHIGERVTARRAML